MGQGGMRYIFVFFLMLFWVPNVWAPPQIRQQSQTPQQQAQQAAQQTVSGQPSGAYYNQILQPQFVIKVLTGTDEKAENGCVGDGDDGSFFGGNYDETYSHWKALGRSTGILHRCGGMANLGTYQFVQIEDRCRTVGGCGTLTPDNRSCILGLPQYATNVVASGQKKICDEIACENPPRDQFSSNANYHDPRWTGRNFIPNFLYGRYLLKCGVWNDPLPNNSIASSMGIHADTGRSGFPYHIDAFPPYFFDCPYTPRDLVEGGFTCSQIAAVDGYRANAGVARRRGNIGGSNFEPMEEERRVFYRTLIEHATNSLGDAIARGTLGDFYFAAPTTAQRERKEIVLNAFAILSEMGPKLDGADCQNTWCRVARFGRRQAGNLITLERGPVPDGSFLHYDHTNHRILVRPDIGRACESKRPSGAHSHFNTQSCNTSYANKIGRGIFDETPFQNPGYELYTGHSVRYPDVDVILGREKKAHLSADGDACQMACKIAHQLVHAYLLGTLNRNRMEDWPSPESLWEEELAVATEALCVDHLADLHYCPKSQELEKDNYIRAITTSQTTATPFVTSSTAGIRFYYSQPPRGHRGISLTPYYTNMFNIARHLKNQRPEDARMTALEVAMCPVFDPPPNMCVDGICGDFVMPQTQIPQQIEPQTQQQQMERGARPSGEIRRQ